MPWTGALRFGSCCGAVAHDAARCLVAPVVAQLILLLVLLGQLVAALGAAPQEATHHKAGLVRPHQPAAMDGPALGQLAGAAQPVHLGGRRAAAQAVAAIQGARAHSGSSGVGGAHAQLQHGAARGQCWQRLTRHVCRKPSIDKPVGLWSCCVWWLENSNCARVQAVQWQVSQRPALWRAACSAAGNPQPRCTSAPARTCRSERSSLTADGCDGAR